MPRTTAFAIALVLLLSGPGRGTAQEDYRRALSFESPGLVGWSGGPAETLSLDSVFVQGGRYAGRINRDRESELEFSSFGMTLPVTFSGETLELRGWLRTDGVTGFAGLWLRQDGRSGSVQFDNMQSRNLRGSTEWTEYRISLPLDERARTVVLGAILVGEGTAWVDNLELLVDGIPASDAPPFVAVLSAVDLDDEFDDGSRVEARDLTPTQVENLTLLGRIWGFVKYHHPRITGGTVNWDYELFRILPSLLDARDRMSARVTLEEWLGDLGDPDSCGRCAVLPADSHLSPDIDWIGDRGLLGDEVSGRLELIYNRRPANLEHYYVSHEPGVGNPLFLNEATYRDQPLPDAGFRLLALYRYWNIIEYWFPYRDVIGENWIDVLFDFVPRVMAASTVDEYRLTLTELITRINDTHANLRADSNPQPPRGSAELPVVLRFVEDEAVVTGFSHPVRGPATGLRIGDVIGAIDGRSVDSLVTAWRPFYPASNQAARLRNIALNLTRGEPGEIEITGTRLDGPFSLSAERVSSVEVDLRAGLTHDLPGETFQLLSDEVAYLKLSSVVAADVANYVNAAADADVLVVDIRNYPSAFMVFALGGRLVTEPTEFARFTIGDASNPGAFSWTFPLTLTPLQPNFSGAVVILVDETSLSQAEYTTMALQAAPNTIVVGSTTAGADGNVSGIPLPGGITTLISGIGVFYPDGTPTQRIGIVPDLEVSPTIAGIREGRDEVLEAGVSYVLGREFRLPVR